MKPNLAQKVMMIGGLTSSLVAGGCFLGDLAEEGLNIVAGRQINPRDAEILGAAKRVVGKAVQRNKNTTVKYEDANVDNYRSREESKIRIAEEKALNEVYNPPIPDEPPEYTPPTPQSQPKPYNPPKPKKTIETIDDILEGNNRQAILGAIQRELGNNPFYWEYNTNLISKAYQKESLTPNDKSKLQAMLEAMYYCTHGELGKLRNICSSTAFSNARLRFKCNVGVTKNTSGIIKLYEFMINHQDTEPRLRCKVLGSYPKQVKIKSNKLSNCGAIDLLRAKIELLENIKRDIPLSEGESRLVYFSDIGDLEYLLRSKLARVDPKFKEKERLLFNEINVYKEIMNNIKQKKIEMDEKKAEAMLTKPWILDLAREIGYFTHLRKITGKTELKPSTEQEKQTPGLEEPEERKSSSAYWLIPLLTVLGLGGGTAYKYRGSFYKKTHPSKKSKKK